MRLIFKDWSNLKAIKKFFIEKNFIEISYTCKNSQLNSLQSAFFRTGKHKYAMILGIIELHSENPNPTKIIELFGEEYKMRYSENDGYDIRVNLITSLIIVSFDRKKIYFLDFSKRKGENCVIKDITEEDLVFNSKLNNLEFNTNEASPFFYTFGELFKSRSYDRDPKIREEIINELVEKNKKISINQLQKYLNFNDKKQFHLQILSWSKKYQFIIDGDNIIVNKNGLNLLIKDLENSYKEWK